MEVPVLCEALERSATECLVFVLRVVDFERIAWREGRERALARERAAAAMFADACLCTLRAAESTFAHEAGADLFLAATPAPAHELPRTARAVLAELTRRLADSTGLNVEGGWTVYVPCGDPARALAETIAAALARGRRERERFAFFAALGHEMRTPLMSIDGYLQTVLESDRDAATNRHFTEVALREAVRLRRLVESMYALSLTDLDTGLTRNVSCDVQHAVERAADAIHAVAARRGTRVKVCSRVQCAIALAAEHAVQLFLNLMENAVKHGAERGRIEIRMEQRENELTIFVDDDGPGVAEADRTRIFGELTRGRTSAGGDGLGLAIVRATVERLGGDIEVRRSPLGGARFVLRLPLAPAPQFHSDITMSSP
jgi:signal transduction histidine kinase